MVLGGAALERGSIDPQFDRKPQLMRGLPNISKKISVIEKNNATHYKKEVSIATAQALPASVWKKPSNKFR
jgi:hypothetical protein